MVSLVTLRELDFQLRLDLQRDNAGEINDPLSSDFEKIVDRASLIVLRHVKREADPWTADTAPDDIRAAVLMVAKNLWDETEEPLSQAVISLLRGRRDPTLA